MIILSLIIPVFILVIIFYYWKLRYFYRDPERISPKGKKIIAPADGTVIYVRKVVDGEVPVAIKNKVSIPLKELTGTNILAKNQYIIGIFMYPTSVHVNRSPIEGVVVGSFFSKGINKPMTITWWRAVLGLRPYDKYSSYMTTNERNTLVVSNDNLTVSVTQIADIYVNKVECWVKEGEKLLSGQRFGRIVFGSQVDTIFPQRTDIKLLVKEGDKVLAGETILATYS